MASASDSEKDSHEARGQRTVGSLALAVAMVVSTSVEARPQALDTKASTQRPRPRMLPIFSAAFRRPPEKAPCPSFADCSFGTAEPEGVVSLERSAGSSTPSDPRFPDGLTVLKADGEFRAESSDIIVKEKSSNHPALSVQKPGQEQPADSAHPRSLQGAVQAAVGAAGRRLVHRLGVVQPACGRPPSHENTKHEKYQSATTEDSEGARSLTEVTRHQPATRAAIRMTRRQTQTQRPGRVCACGRVVLIATAGSAGRRPHARTTANRELREPTVSSVLVHCFW